MSATDASTPTGTAVDNIDVCGDGSILKEILVEGSGDETPVPGSKCTVHYVGTLLDGSKFDSSRDRDDPFKFTIGQGVITGWSEGVASMRLGEKANFTIQSHKAYGENGSPPKIPGGATLVFEIELLQFTNDVEVTTDGGVTMKHLKQTDGWKTADDLATCTANLTFALAANASEVVHEASAVTFVVGDGDVPRGVELAVKKMKEGEKARIKIRSDYGFGVEGSEAHKVPPHAAIVVELELTVLKNTVQPYEIVDFTPSHAEANALKTKGNELFKAGSFANAVRRYDFALKFTDKDAGFTDEEREQMKAITLSCHLNTAQCYLKQKRPSKAKQACDKAVALDAANVKGLFRRGTALFDMGEHAAAVGDFKRCLALDADNKAASQSLKKAELAIKQQNQKDKKMFSKMFA